MSGYEAVREDAAWISLGARGRLQITGDDSARLLHAMSTNDIKNLAENEGLYSFFLNAQGRILADANIYHRPEAFVLDAEPETGDKVREHLDKYIIADDAQVEPIEGWTAVAIEGPNAIAHAERLGIPVPVARYATAAWDSGFVARVGSVCPDGVRIFGPAQAMEQLGLSIPQLTPDEARLVRIENGIPRYGDDIGERYLVQETGLLHGVHFNKGCYLGQEIVERVRSRAQVHRFLKSVRIKGTETPAPGTKLQLNGKDAAEITSAAYSPRLGEVAALAYVRTEALTNHDGADWYVVGS